LPTLFFIVESPFSERDWDRFGISDLLAQFDVWIHDLTPVSNSELWDRKSSIQTKSDRVVTHFSIGGFLESIHTRRPRCCILNLGEGENRSVILRNLKQRRILSAEFQLGAMPGPQTSQMSTVERIEQRLKQSSSPVPLLEIFRKKWHLMRVGKDLPDLFFRAGTLASGRHPELGREIVDVHSLDYESFRESSAPTPTEVARKAVYLDQDIGFHSDLKTLGMRSPVTPEVFYSETNAYFNWLRDTCGLTVVICPHPRADKDQVAVRFPGQKISELSTSREIFGSRVVLGHVSTSFSFAVLAGRPTQILTSNELSKSWYWPFIAKFTDELRAPLINLSDPGTWMMPANEISSEQQTAYTTYVKNYMRSYSGTDGRLWQMIGTAIIQRVNA